MTFPEIDLHLIAPALIVAVTALLVLVGELVTPAGRKAGLGYVSLLGVALAGIAAVTLWRPAPAVASAAPAAGFAGMVVADNFGIFLSLVVLLGAALTILLSIPFIRTHRIDQGEYYVLLLGSVAGMIVMVTAADLIVVFLGLELLSLPLYILAAFERENSRSLEAGIKYFLLGAFSSAFFLYGIALVFGATGSTNLAKIYAALVGATDSSVMLRVGLGLLIVGYGFKVALVPFHWWTPDVYEGAPTTVTGFMSVAVKAAAFGALFRTVQFALPALDFDWRVVLAVLAVLTMTLGNVAALLQSNIKRMLAYSSIAHAGYILIALVSFSDAGLSSALFHLLAYLVTNLGAFGAVIALSRGDRERLEIKDYAGAAREHPWIALALAVCLLSLGGFPPFAGFVAKFFVFSAAVESGLAWLAVIGVLNSLVSVYFYLRPVVQMFMSEPLEGWKNVRTEPLAALAIAIALVGVIALGLFPAYVLAWAQAALLR